MFRLNVTIENISAMMWWSWWFPKQIQTLRHLPQLLYVNDKVASTLPDADVAVVSWNVIFLDL